jgi:hypothetical protein
VPSHVEGFGHLGRFFALMRLLHFFLIPVIVMEETNTSARDGKSKEEIMRRLLHLAALSFVTMFLLVPRLGFRSRRAVAGKEVTV